MQFNITKIFLVVAIGMTTSVAFAAAVEPTSPVRCCMKEDCTQCSKWLPNCKRCTSNMYCCPI
ncbi:hypothetical protein F5883DRAFT_718714 [Diaporthe sp. PMI_573]|nr:hypothetical protein F5883DRAFT_718714 [Diaporthaceae sp. PMI_573]